MASVHLSISLHPLPLSYTSLASTRACLKQHPCSSFFSPGLNTSTSNIFFRHGRELAVGRKRPHQPGRLVVEALFGLGVPELVVIAGVAAVVFGPKKLPEIGKSLGKTLKSFQQATKEFEAELKKEDSVTAETTTPDASKITSPDNER